MDAPGDALPGGADGVEGNDQVIGHARSMAATPAHTSEVRLNLRVCAISDIMMAMLDTTVPTSSEFDRQRYAAVGRALADPKRLCVLESLAAGELSVGDLSTKVGCQVPNMSQHLAVLRSAGLVQSRRDGSTVFYRLADVRVLEAYRLIQSLAGQGA